MYGFTRKNSNACHDSTIIHNHFKITRIHKTFFSSKPDRSTMREMRVRNSGPLKECWRLGHPYTAGISTKHYWTDKLRWSAFSISITMLVFEKQLFRFTIRSFTRSPSLNKGSYKKLISARLCRFKFRITRQLFTPTATKFVSGNQW